MQANSSRDKDGRLYDSRQGLGGYYRYGPRKLELLCDVRFSVTTRRCRADSDPRFIRAHSNERSERRACVRSDWTAGEVRSRDGERTDTGGWEEPVRNARHASARAKGQEHVWNFVWCAAGRLFRHPCGIPTPCSISLTLSDQSGGRILNSGPNDLGDDSPR